MASRNVDSELAWRETIGFRMHLMMCKTCHRYVKQLKFLKQAISKFAQHRQTDDNIKLSEEARNRIRSTLSQHDTTLRS